MRRHLTRPLSDLILAHLAHPPTHPLAQTRTHTHKPHTRHTYTDQSLTYTHVHTQAIPPTPTPLPPRTLHKGPRMEGSATTLTAGATPLSREGMRRHLTRPHTITLLHPQTKVACAVSCRVYLRQRRQKFASVLYLLRAGLESFFFSLKVVVLF